MKRSNCNLQLIVVLLAATVFLGLDSTANAWRVQRFYRSRSGSLNRNVADALKNRKWTGHFFPTAPNIQTSRDRRVHRFHRTRRTESVPQRSTQPRFSLFGLFR